VTKPADSPDATSSAGGPYVVESPPELVEHSRALAARITASAGA